jgi:hypothetical protein
MIGEMESNPGVGDYSPVHGLLFYHEIEYWK